MIPIKKYIVCLVGTNPLPAFITILKNYKVGTKVLLVHTEGSVNNIGSKVIAQNLKKVLEEKFQGIDIELLECDKSNMKKIDSFVNRLFRNIKKSIGDDCKAELLLDYTSGTKAMSAVISERVINSNIDGISTRISYVDDNQNIVLEDEGVGGESRIYQIRDVIKNCQISIKEVVNIYGYKIKEPIEEKIYEKDIKYLFSKEPIMFYNDIGNSIYIDEVYLLDGKLALCFKSKYLGEREKVGKLKLELFEFKDKAEKLGGSRSIIVYQTDCSEVDERKLRKYLKRDYEFEMERRLEFVKENETFRDKILGIYFK